MKIVSAIMAIYIMGLLFVPCADLHAENDSGKAKFEISDTQENHIDTCSPFCFCECCQTISQPVIDHFFQFYTTLISTSVTIIRISEYSVHTSMWRPPKI